jgi:predicted SAM-dependent methyltransferase
MKLNLGSRDTGFAKKEWVNLDIVRAKKVNVIGTGAALPFRDNSFEEIHCVHVLEHVRRHLHEPFLSEMHRTVRPGGLVYVEVPNFETIVTENLHKAFKAGDERAIHIWTTSIYGKNDIVGMEHHWGFYPGLLRKKFCAAGFTTVNQITEKEQMISTHYRQEPVLLMVGIK